MTIPYQPKSQTKYTEQYMGNASYDEEFNVNVVEGLVYNPVTGTLDRNVQAGATLPTSGLNASYVLTRNGSGYITSIAQTIGATTYTKTITRDGSNYITNIGVWT
jgi:hypothetical protein